MDSRTLYCRTPEKWFGADIQRNDSDFLPKIRVTARKSEIQAKNRRHGRVAPPNPNRIAQRRCPNGVWIFLQKRAWKPLWIQLNDYPPPINVFKINFKNCGKLQNCSCIKETIPKCSEAAKIGQAQVRRENKCLRAEIVTMRAGIITFLIPKESGRHQASRINSKIPKSQE